MILHEFFTRPGGKSQNSRRYKNSRNNLGLRQNPNFDFPKNWTKKAENTFEIRKHVKYINLLRIMLCFMRKYNNLFVKRKSLRTICTCTMLSPCTSKVSECSISTTQERTFPDFRPHSSKCISCKDCCYFLSDHRLYTF